MYKSELPIYCTAGKEDKNFYSSVCPSPCSKSSASGGLLPPPGAKIDFAAAGAVAAPQVAADDLVQCVARTGVRR